MEVIVERLTQYSPDVAAGIGRLMPFLSERLPGSPIDEVLLEAIITSPHHDQLVAQHHQQIVGAATLNLLMGPGMTRQGYLEDFVVDPDVRGSGVGDAVWQEMIGWCLERGVNLAFTSHPSRKAAHRFYLRNGAEIRETTSFVVPVGDV